MKGYWLIVCGFFVATSGSLQAFTLISNGGKLAYWPSGVVQYRFNTTASGYFGSGHDASGTATDEFDPIRNSFSAWTSLTGLNLSVSELSSTTLDPDSGDRINTIKWIGSSWRNLGFHPPSNALAVTLLSFSSTTGQILDADIYFNAENFHWAVVDSGSENSYIDVANIATHEIGHLFGLDHSSETLGESDPDLRDATMFYASRSGETSRRTVHTDDENAIRSLYGNDSRSAPTITSVSLESSSTYTAQYRVQGTGFNDLTSFVLTHNNMGLSDSVSRYKTIYSSSLAVVEFDMSNIASGDGQLVAFNSPSLKSTYNLTIEGGLLSANSSGGGGGCQLRIDESSSISWGACVLMALAIACVWILRRQNKVSIRVKSK